MECNSIINGAYRNLPSELVAFEKVISCIWKFSKTRALNFE